MYAALVDARHDCLGPVPENRPSGEGGCPVKTWSAQSAIASGFNRMKYFRQFAQP
jgi:hypothetical protein